MDQELSFAPHLNCFTRDCFYSRLYQLRQLRTVALFQLALQLPLSTLFSQIASTIDYLSMLVCLLFDWSALTVFCAPAARLSAKYQSSTLSNAMITRSFYDCITH